MRQRSREVVATESTLRRMAIIITALLAALAGATFTGARIQVSAASLATAPDTAGDVGLFSSLALDGSGNPVVSYYDVGHRDLKVLHCGNASCTAGNTIAKPDTGDAGQFSSLALDGSGKPVVSYSDDASHDLKVLHCGNAYCTAGNTIVAPDTFGNVGTHTSVALDGSGRPVVSYSDTTNGHLKLLHCGNANCTVGNSIVTADASGIVGTDTSLALDTAGFPVVSYRDLGNGDLKLLHCNDSNCTGSDESITSPDTNNYSGLHTSLRLTSDGSPIISYNDGYGSLRVLHCGDPNCTSGNNIAVPAAPGWYTSLALDSAGSPVVSSHENGGGLALLHCATATCTTSQTITKPDAAGDVGWYTSLELDTAGNPVVAYYDASNGDLKLLHCADPACSSGNSVIRPDTNGFVGTGSSLAVDASGFPVVSYQDATSAEVKLLHCNDPSCAGDNDIIASLGVLSGVDSGTSLALDSGGNPVISYVSGGLGSPQLSVIHCNDPDCMGGDEGISPVDSGDPNERTRLVLDGSGNPVVTYLSGFPDPDLRLVHCNDPNCAGADDSIVTLFAGNGSSGPLALDASGSPVIAYPDYDGLTLQVLHCGNSNCASGNTQTSVDAGYLRDLDLVLDSTESPVVAYFDNDTFDFRLLHCGNTDCTAGNSIAYFPNGAGRTALQLDAAGNPAIVYGFNKLLRCGNPACTSGNTVTVLELNGLASLRLDASERPVLSAGPSYDLAIVHCGDPACIGTKPAAPAPAIKDDYADTDGDTIPNLSDSDDDGDGCPDAKELTTGPLAETYGGRRNPHNSNDYFNPTHDHANRIDDILIVVNEYFDDDGDGNPGLPPYAPGYTPDTDRTLVGPNPWNLGPPNGLQRVDDILNQLHQYFHDCA